MNKKILNITIEAAAVLSSVYGIIKTYQSPLTLTYFTTLSNIFISIILSIFLIKNIRSLITKKEITVPNFLYIIKFLATISITLTFFVFLTILAPTIDGGILYAYLGNGAGSLFVHFIAPILAIIDFLLFDKEYKSKKIHAIYATIPPLLYVIFVVIASQAGLRWGKMAAPYNFLNYQAPTGWFGFNPSLMSWETLGIGVAYMIILLTILFIIIGRIFLLIKDKANKR